jgi:hypothetical protein
MKTTLTRCTLFSIIFTFGSWIPAFAAEMAPAAAAAEIVAPVVTENPAPVAVAGTAAEPVTNIEPAATPAANAELTAAPTASAEPAAATNLGLLSMVTSQLGVSEQQATAGISALMGLVKQNLSATDYATLIGGAPDLGAVANATAPDAAPAPSSSGGWLESIGSMLGYKSVGQMAQLAETFSQLGLPADMVAKFLKVALEYVQGTGGSALVGLMSGALK